MTLGSKTTLSTVVALCTFICGCTTVDPFHEKAWVPATPSAIPSLKESLPPEIAPPRVVPLYEKGPLSLAQCMWEALENNPRTRVSWRKARGAAAALGAARGQYLPQVEFRSTAQRQQFQVLTEIEDKFLRTTYDAAFGVRHLLLDGGVRRATVNAAEAGRDSADFVHHSVLLDVALATEVAYYELLAAQSLLQVGEDMIRQRAQHLKLARELKDAGLGRRVDELRAEAEKADAELAVVEARNLVRVTRGRLASTMGLRVTSAVQIMDIPEHTRRAEQEDVERLLTEAARNRPRLRAVVAEVNRLRHVLEAEKAARWPQLNASGSYGWRDTRLLPGERKEWAIALSLSVPLFTGFQRTYRIFQADEELESAIAGYEQLLRDAELEVWEAYSSVLRADEAIEASETFLASSRESLSVTESEYKQGKATIVELTDAQTGLTRALNRKVKARLDWYLAIARLERAVGKSWSQDIGANSGQTGQTDYFCHG